MCHHAPDSTLRTFGRKRIIGEGVLATELDAMETRPVHLAHYYPPQETFAEPLAVDSETHELG